MVFSWFLDVSGTCLGMIMDHPLILRFLISRNTMLHLCSFWKSSITVTTTDWNNCEDTVKFKTYHGDHFQSLLQYWSFIGFHHLRCCPEMTETYVCVCLYIYISIYLYIHIYIYTHTHTHMSCERAFSLSFPAPILRFWAFLAITN